MMEGYDKYDPGTPYINISMPAKVGIKFSEHIMRKNNVNHNELLENALMISYSP